MDVTSESRISRLQGSTAARDADTRFLREALRQKQQLRRKRVKWGGERKKAEREKARNAFIRQHGCLAGRTLIISVNSEKALVKFYIQFGYRKPCLLGRFTALCRYSKFYNWRFVAILSQASLFLLFSRVWLFRGPHGKEVSGPLQRLWDKELTLCSLFFCSFFNY